jgi:CHAT domain-containing protein
MRKFLNYAHLHLASLLLQYVREEIYTAFNIIQSISLTIIQQTKQAPHTFHVHRHAQHRDLCTILVFECTVCDRVLQITLLSFPPPYRLSTLLYRKSTLHPTDLNRAQQMAFSGILAVSQPQHQLPKTEEEVQIIQNYFGNKSVVWLNGESATVTTVLDHMRIHCWVHFACHATQSVSDPTTSHFHLHNETLDIRRIMKEQFNGQFAFLSACETATCDETLPEESVHLAAGVMMAGYPAVIGTLWSIMDKDGPLVAKEVYSHLYNNGSPDSSWQAACALHNAVAHLRNGGEQNFLSWVPFIHLGK